MNSSRVACWIRDPFLAAEVADAAAASGMECFLVSDLGLIRLEERFGSHKWLVCEACEPEKTVAFVNAYLSEFSDRKVVLIVRGAPPKEIEDLIDAEPKRLLVFNRARFLVVARRLFEVGELPDEEEFGPEWIKAYVEQVKLHKKKESANTQPQDSAEPNNSQDANSNTAAELS